MILGIDDDACRGHGVCVSVCPELFTLTDAGYAEVTSAPAPPELEEAAARAVAACPERAITTLEERNQ